MKRQTRRQSMDAIETEVALLVRGARKFLNATAAVLAPELPPAAHAIMTHISARSRLSPAVIIAVTGIDRSVVSRQLAALVRGGYIVSEPDPSDGRVSLYSPTASTTERFARIQLADEEKLEEAFGEWSADELTTLASLLGKFNRTVQGL